MLKTLRLIAGISRPEFLPANLASLVMAISWAINPAMFVAADVLVSAALSFVILTLVSLIGAQLNSMFDYELDCTDANKKGIVQDIDRLGRSKIKSIIIVEFLLSLPFIILLLSIRWQPILLFMWLAGNFLAYSYSAPPFRLKSRSWLEFLSLLLALCVLLVMFVYFTVTSEISPLFLLFLVGQSMTVYSLIIPTETRDYFVDKAMNVETMTVRLGLARASLLGIVLLSAGGILLGAAFFLALASMNRLPLAIFLLAMAVADCIVLKVYRKLYSLSKMYASNGQDSIKQEIVKLSANNPKWITMVSQTIVLMSIVFIVGKFWF